MKIFKSGLLKMRSFFMLISAVVLTALSVTLFSFSLEKVIDINHTYPFLIFFLPFIGAICIFLYNRFSKKAKEGNLLIKRSYHDIEKKPPFLMAVLAPIATILSHLFGASVGREGIAVQMGGTIFIKIVDLFGEYKKYYRMMLVSGVAAGFAAMFGTPLAAFVFSLEFFGIRHIKWKEAAVALFSSVLSYYITVMLFAKHHFSYNVDTFPMVTVTTFFLLIILGIVLGILGRLFIVLLHYFKSIYQKIHSDYYRIVLGGTVVVIVSLLLSYLRPFAFYGSLGMPLIEGAFIGDVNLVDTFAKMLLTTLTIAAGFFGGEVTPLFAMGASAGSGVSLLSQGYLPVSFSAAIGYVGVFVAAANVPFTGIVMLGELFGFKIIMYGFIVLIVAYFVSGRDNIYQIFEKEVL